MFTIIGGDGREYGPATAEQIRGWITAGRASLETKAKALGSDEWRRLGDFAEFAPVSAPPPIPIAPLTPPAVDPDLTLMGQPTPMPQPASAIPMPMAARAAVPAANLAERGPRFLARFIDWAIEFVIAIPGAAILGTEFMKLVAAVMQGRQPDFEDLDMKRLILGGGVLAGCWLILLVIQVWMLASRGQSIGKRIVGLRVVKLDGSHAGIVHAWLLREFAISAIGFVLNVLPFIGPILLRPAFHITDWCLIFRDDQRCLHDLLASTKVVKA